MPRFFIQQNQVFENTIRLFGEDAHHIARSLRMAVGDELTVCDMQGREYECTIESFEEDREVLVRICSSRQSEREPLCRVSIFQALPKGDKLDTVIQKAVECGVDAVTPFESAHCIVRIKPEAEDKKTDRRRRIALEAAKQCGRGSIPEIFPSISFSEALSRASEADLALFCYEGEGTQPLRTVLSSYIATRPQGIGRAFL